MLYYLACPYSHNSQEVIEQRMHLFGEMAAKLINQGLTIVSPLTNHLLIQQGHDIAGNWEFWKNFSNQLLSKCECLLVYTLDGYLTSSGVQGEIEIAKQNNIPIVYITLNDDGETIKDQLQSLVIK